MIYKVTNFEEVYCPRDGCEATLDTEGEFFHQLPIDIQLKYPKVHRFHLTTKDPTIKLCPRDNCDGLIKKQCSEMKCTHCYNIFCANCLLGVHKGACDRRELQFF